MNKSEAALILAAAAARDQRTVGEADVLAWHEDLADIDYPTAREALRRHYRDSTERIMPAHIRRLARAIRDERRPQHEVRALPSRFEPDMTRNIRLERGIAQCREVVGPILARLKAAQRTDRVEPSKSDQIRERALEVARAAKKGQRA